MMQFILNSNWKEYKYDYDSDFNIINVYMCDFDWNTYL